MSLLLAQTFLEGVKRLDVNEQKAAKIAPFELQR
jgi:hypothetical protein